VTEQDGDTQLFVSGHPPGAFPAVDRDDDVQCWWATDYGSWRLSAEREAMRRHFPSFYTSDTADGRRCWLGWLRSGLDPERRYLVRVTYPYDFPDHPPEVRIERPRLADGVPHLLGPQRPCLYLPSQGSRNAYDPGRTTAATLVAWTALWVHAFETWRATGRWPGRSD
jgi:hypothetical protein